MDLKKEITESMRGIIIDNGARTDDEIVEWYADVFVCLVEDYTKEKVKRIKELEQENNTQAIKLARIQAELNALINSIEVHTNKL